MYENENKFFKKPQSNFQMIDPDSIIATSYPMKLLSPLEEFELDFDQVFPTKESDEKNKS